MSLTVGDKLYGNCGGLFLNSATHETKTVEAVGSNWLVAKEEYGKTVFFLGNLARLDQYKTDPLSRGYL